MKIHCCRCHEILEDDDVLIMDLFNTLFHRDCYFGKSHLIKDIDDYINIKNKYWFFNDKKVNRKGIEIIWEWLKDPLKY